MTLTILVGFEVGAKRFTDARKYSRLGIVLSLLFTISLAMILIHLRADIAALYTNDDFVKKLLQLFLVYAICLQVSDGVSAPLQGTLRGYKDVKITFILAVVSYWIIGLPTGYALANYFNYGPYGYWIGLIAGIAAGAVFLGIRLFRVQKRAAFLMEK